MGRRAKDLKDKLKRRIAGRAVELETAEALEKYMK